MNWRRPLRAPNCLSVSIPHRCTSPLLWINRKSLCLGRHGWTNGGPYSEQAEVIYAGDYAELPNPDSIDTNDPTRLLKAIPLQDVWDKISAKLEALEA